MEVSTVLEAGIYDAPYHRAVSWWIEGRLRDLSERDLMKRVIVPGGPAAVSIRR